MKPRPALAFAAAAATALAATSLAPLFQNRSWVIPSLGAIIVVAVAGAVVRRFRLPAVFTVVGAFAALHLYLTAYFTGDHALLWVIPTTDSITEMLNLLREGRHTAQTYAAPLPVGDGVRIMTAFGIGFVAAMVDLLAVRLRRAAPAGLPLLAMYSVPAAAARSESVSWIAFALGAGGYLVLLAMEAREQVGLWGRAVPSRYGSLPTASPRLPSGKRVGLAAIAVAVAIPALVPGLGAHGIFDLDDRQGGSATITTADPLVDLKRKLTDLGDTEVLRYTTDDPDPDYLRMYALDVFEEERWTYSALGSGTAPRIADGVTLPRVPGLSVSAHVSTKTVVTVGPDVRDMKFLAMPYAPRTVEIDGNDWRADRDSLMVYSPSSDADGLTYTVSSRRATPSAAQLRRAEGGGPMKYTRIDTPLPEEVHRLVRKVTENARTRFDRALAIQRWFNREFTYSLDPAPPTQMSDLLAFLNDRRGYCEQFAATMALMTRSLGIPTRVVVGYAPGTRTSDGTYVVRQRDAHAWPELYFEGTGWVRFEPTPPGTGAPTSVGAPEYTEPRRPDAQNGTDDTETDSAEPTPSAEASAAATPTPTAGAAADTPDGRPTEGGFTVPILWILGILAVLLVLAAPRLVRDLVSLLRWRRAPDPAAAAWAQLRADTLDHSLGWQVSESPRAVVGRLGPRLGPDAAQPLARIALAQELARYAPPEALPPQGTQGLRADAAAVRAAMSDAVPGPVSLRARLLPASSLDAVRRAWSALRARLPHRDHPTP
ncbi:transglutaminaseTgpA domain-containing protein [Actinocorallia sp. A-T 12471]|uniref:transglutaminase family protein n=1 Tax=Actinocorallia sp. A-T 12471 TaxID=3089813 RepID=UPI0029D00004|nr:transglutaminaseTgpA domain-containing protein [Actinocorallia sp. A-T 12471]MDX6743083.1 transglutaminaseTgpA domain-containing protein [Actinocorallia sp. A-T 12471]